MAKADCELPRRAVRGDVVTFTHDFSRRIGRHDPLAQDNMRTQWALTHAATHVVRSVPANSIVQRIRTDVIWEDVVSNAGYPIRQFRNGLSLPLTFVSSSMPTFSYILNRIIPENRRQSQAEPAPYPLLLHCYSTTSLYCQYWICS